MSDKKFPYVEVGSDSFRRAYGEGRIAIKVSLVPSTFFGMEELGVINSIINPRTKKPVAARGGNGSSFADFAAHFLLYLYRDYGSDEIAARNDALNILRILERAIIKAEDTDVVKENLVTLLKIVTGQRAG